MNDAVIIMESIMSWASPLLLALITMKARKYEKSVSEMVTLQTQLTETNERLREQEQQILLEKFSSIDLSIQSLSLSIQEMERKINKIEQIEFKLNNVLEFKINNIHTMSKLNNEFVVSMSSLVDSIAKSLIAADVDNEILDTNKVNQELEKHTRVSNEMLQKIYENIETAPTVPPSNTNSS